MLWENKVEVKKGDLGESLVDEFIKASGDVPYIPNADKAHPFDRLCASQNKKNLYIAEVKSKSRRKYYPDTGFNISNYHDYVNIQKKYNLKVFIFFVDEEMGLVYGERLNELLRPVCVIYNGKKLTYPIQTKKLILFPLILMKRQIEINEKAINELKMLTTKNKSYIKGM